MITSPLYPHSVITVGPVHITLILHCTYYCRSLVNTCVMIYLKKRPDCSNGFTTSFRLVELKGMEDWWSLAVVQFLVCLSQHRDLFLSVSVWLGSALESCQFVQC